MDGNASNGADDGLSRRGLLMGTALLGVGTATLASGAGDAVAANACRMMSTRSFGTSGGNT